METAETNFAPFDVIHRSLAMCSRGVLWWIIFLPRRPRPMMTVITWTTLVPYPWSHALQRYLSPKLRQMLRLCQILGLPKITRQRQMQ